MIYLTAYLCFSSQKKSLPIAEWVRENFTEEALQAIPDATEVYLGDMIDGGEALPTDGVLTLNASIVIVPHAVCPFFPAPRPAMGQDSTGSMRCDQTLIKSIRHKAARCK